MDHAFWLQRWREGRIGFHRNEVMPLLQRHWDSLALARGSRVLVPLCGKSLDMIWLAAQGYRVLGVELSALAIAQFASDNALAMQVHASPLGRHHVAGAIEIIEGDAFALDAATLADCQGVYDRAALIALPPDLRERYVDELHGRLPTGCRGLLITLEYPQAEKQGPPFSVEEVEVRTSFGPRWDVALVERRDILAHEPAFAAEGVSALSTAVYRLQRKDGDRAGAR